VLPHLEVYLGFSIRDYLDFKPEEIEKRTQRNFFGLSNLFINDLEGLDDIPDFYHCVVLNLDHNLLMRFDSNTVRGFAHLGAIDLSFNRIAFVSNFAFIGASKLVSLNLSYNPLTVIESSAFQGIPTLFDLDLSMSGVIQLPEHVFDSLVHLKKLDLHGNQLLDSLPENAFNSLVSLEILELHKTGLQELWLSSFQGLSSLLYFALNNNQYLEFIDPRIFLFLPHLQRIDLSGNGLPVENVKQIEAIARSRNENIRINF
jgi:Leucine-rich repeat (LRR) protein